MSLKAPVEGFAAVLLKKIGKSKADFTIGIPDEDEEKLEENQKAIEGRTDIGPTQKQQLVLPIFQISFRINGAHKRISADETSKITAFDHPTPMPFEHSLEKFRTALLSETVIFLP